MLKSNLKLVASLFLVLSAVVAAAPTASLAAPPSGHLYLNGDIVVTHGVPARLPHGGTDPLYMVTNGVADQLGIATYGPGEQNYNGGSWAVSLVSFNDGVTPYLLTSASDVMAAEQAGDVTVTRMPNMDNRCPLQP